MDERIKLDAGRKPVSEFYERMREEIELLRDVRTAMQQIDAGRGVSRRDAKAELRSRFRG